MRLRRVITVVVSLAGLMSIILLSAPPILEEVEQPVSTAVEATGSVVETLGRLEVKGRAPKTNYSRSQFGSGWATTGGCDTRNIILHRDLKDPQVDEKCTVISGRLFDPYTGLVIDFVKGDSDIQIDHVVALSNAWQTGAQQLLRDRRIQLANDPLNLLAVQGQANQQKSDADAASWLPSNKGFRCDYIARQVAVKQKYALWVTVAEKEVMTGILASCPDQLLPAK